ncbi:MAG: KEOPS complex subunit Pcc1 [Natronomonas sp.]
MKRATIRTSHDRPELVAAALVPDNTDEMSTHVTDSVVETTIERDSTGGLRTTADDYVTNLTVAQQIIDTTTQS